MSTLDDLYAELSIASGVLRIRDPRLELIAMDRALEARYEVGTTAANGISHPVDQLIARTVPWKVGVNHSVHENAVWSYESSWQGDFVPHVVEAWMNSPAHFANLTRVTDSHWGIGYHVEPPGTGQTNNRIYVIAVFTTGLVPLTKRDAPNTPGPATAHQFGALGQILATKSVKSIGLTSTYDYRLEIPGKGPHLRLTKGGFKNYWVPEL